MASLNDLTEKDLLQPENFEKVKRAFLECLEGSLTPESRRFADLLDKKIGPTLETANPELAQKYRVITACLKFIAAATLDKNTFLTLVRSKILDAFKNGVDLNDRMTLRMYSLPDTAWEDEKQEILTALKENKQILSSQPITLKGDSETSTPTVQSWLNDYDRTMGPEKQDDIRQKQYFAQNPNVKALGNAEKNLLLQVIKFYDNLKPLPIRTIDAYLRAAGLNPETLTEEAPGAGAAKEAPVFAKPSEEAKMRLEGQNLTQQNKLTGRGDAYREAVDAKDLTPHPPIQKPSTPPNQPNVVDLKDLNQ